MLGEREPDEPPRVERSETRGGEDGSSDETALVAELRLRLKKSGPAPAVDNVTAALRLALGKRNALENIASGSHSKVRKLRDRILAEDLLDQPAGNEAGTQPMDDIPSASLPYDLEPTSLSLPLGLAAGAQNMLVWPDWIRKHAPRIRRIEIGRLDFDMTQSVATRTLRAHVEGCEAVRETTITYELVRESGTDDAIRCDRNRRREEKAIRELDGVAAVEHRAWKATERHEARIVEAAVAQTVDALVNAVCSAAVAWEPVESPPHLAPGDWMWMPPVSASGPQLVRIDARFHNGVVDVTPIDSATGEFTCSAVRLAAA